LYINDLPKATNLQTVLVADDGQGFSTGKNLPSLIELNKELNNGVPVVTAKTKYIIFHNKGSKVDMGGWELVFDDNEIGYPPNPK
jgi:hypothetical protein